MNKLNYNRFFHLHTVTGIVISVGLYIIFFAGAFTLFWDEIEAWENADSISKVKTNNEFDVLDINIDVLLKQLENDGYSVTGRDFYVYKKNSDSFYTRFYESKDSLEINKEEFVLDITPEPKTNTFSIKKVNKNENFSLGLLFYRLHYFYQLDMFGYYLAGFVSFFFLFAIVTGVIVHWKKIISNFYVFRPWSKLKTVWTDAHTVLGMIGLPFQFMYALTGAMFCLFILIMPLQNIPNKTETAKNTIEIVDNELKDSTKQAIYSNHLITPFLDSIQSSWKGFSSRSILVKNYGKHNTTLRIYGSVKKQKQFYHNASINYDFGTKKITSKADPNDLSYTKAIYEVAGNLHHAKYGEIGTWQNYLLKVIYFLMAFITCFVIITGVLIWLTARYKKNVPEKQRKFNAQVGYIYLAICLTMYPITALTFIVSKLIPESLNPDRKLILYWVFFGGWLLLSIFFWLKKNNYFNNKYTLLSGGILGLGVPVTNGISSGNWLWISFANKNYDVFVFDMLWLVLSGIALFVVYLIDEKIK
jgi:uncharacterized iron-regulated membrane protein